MSPVTLASREHELEALLRLAAAERILEAVTTGQWWAGDDVLGHVELLVRQARRRLGLVQMERLEQPAA